MYKDKIKNSLKVSFWDGFFCSCMMGLTTEYITPYALALKASVSQIGILSAIPNLTASLTQLKSPDITEKIGNRKKVIVVSVFLHALMGIPIILIPYFFKNSAIMSLIIFVTLFSTFNAVSGPAWMSLLTDYLPGRKRGAYFGWRNKVLGMVTIVSLFIGGFILQFFKQNVLKGFFVIFTIAIICRFVSWYFLTRMHETRMQIKKDSYFSFLDFISRIKESNFAKFVFFVSSFTFCVNLASPFFSVFMLRDLRFNYLIYTLLITTVSITSFLTIERWGKNADKIGNMKVLRVTSLLIASLPALWIINRNTYFLLFAQIVSGFAWAGFNLCSLNFIYDAVSPAKRTRCISYFNVCNGVAICLGALIGGYLANRLPELFGYKLLSLFLIASFLRFIVAIFFSRKIKEVRPVEEISTRNLFYSVMGIKPIAE